MQLVGTCTTMLLHFIQIPTCGWLDTRLEEL